MLIQEYQIYHGSSYLMLPPTAQFMSVAERFGNLYAFFMVEEDDFQPLIGFKVSTTPSCGNKPEGEYLCTTTYMSDILHVFGERE